MVDIVPVIAIPAGVGFAHLPRRAAAGTLALGMVLTPVTIELLAGYWNQSIPRSVNTGQQYWQQVLGGHSTPKA